MDARTQALRDRTKQFAPRVLRLFRSLPNRPDGRILGSQILRSGTSVAANYRAACRARSRADFISKMGIVVEEMDETVFWLEFLVDGGLVKANCMQALLVEANELLSIFAASQLTAKSHGVGRSNDRKLLSFVNRQ
jgi:four helix bundle protein